MEQIRVPSKRSKCECNDSGCPCAQHGHKGRARRYYRIDMDGQYGTYFCETCGADALASGVFR